MSSSNSNDAARDDFGTVIDEAAKQEKDDNKNATANISEAGAASASASAAGGEGDADISDEQRIILDTVNNITEADKLAKNQAGTGEQEDHSNAPTGTDTPKTGTIQNDGIREILASEPQQPQTQNDPTVMPMPMPQRGQSWMVMPMPIPGLQRDSTRRRPQPGAYAGGAEGDFQRNMNLNYELVGANTNDVNGGPPALIVPPRSSDRVVHHDQLAVANPVTGDAEVREELMHANPVDLEAAQQKELEQQIQQRIFIAGLLWIVLVAAIIMGFVIAKNRQKEPEAIVTTDTPTVYWSMTPSEVPSSAPSAVLDSLLEILPNYTQESLKAYDTPQWKAWEWLSEHPNVMLFPEWKKEQVFAMATLFYSMEGEHWYKPIRERWLDYELDECEWFSGAFGIFQADGTFYYLPKEYVDPHCNQLGQFMELHLVQLQLQDLKPSIPPEISLLTNLSTMVLPLNGIEMTLPDFLPSTLSQTTSLARLWLAGNNFYGQLPTRLGMMTQLTALVLHSNNITGTIPSEIGLLTNLSWCALSQNSLTGSVPSSLWLLPSLTTLDLGGVGVTARTNQLTGDVPSDIGRLTKLESLDLAQNLFTGSLQSELGLLTSLEYLEMQENFITGSLPSEVAMMTSLVFLRLESNMLTGTVPISELQLLTNLERLQLGSNDFSGSIPSELGKLVSLKRLDLSNLPMLAGSIPSEIGHLTLLTALDLFACSITGAIPTEIGLLTSLQRLDLHNNSLTGAPPQQLNESMGLRLDGNMFTGTVPNHLCSTLWCDCSPNATVVQSCFDLTESLEYPGRFPPKDTQEQDDSIMFNYHTGFWASNDWWAWLREPNETDVWETLQDGSNMEKDFFLYSFLLPVSTNKTYKLVFSLIDETRIIPPGWITLTSSNRTVLYSLLGSDGVEFTEIGIFISVATDGSLTATPTLRCESDFWCDDHFVLRLL